MNKIKKGQGNVHDVLDGLLDVGYGLFDVTTGESLKPCRPDAL